MLDVDRSKASTLPFKFVAPVSDAPPLRTRNSGFPG
jgi:hypothetical protein